MDYSEIREIVRQERGMGNEERRDADWAAQDMYSFGRKIGLAVKACPTIGEEFLERMEDVLAEYISDDPHLNSLDNRLDEDSEPRLMESYYNGIKSAE